MNTWGKVLIGALIVAIVGFTAFQFIDWESRTEAVCDKEREEERRQWQERVAELEATIAELETSLPSETAAPAMESPPILSEKPGDLFSEGIALIGEEEPPACSDVSAWIENYFAYLDEQAHVQALELEKGIQAEYNRMMERIAENPPVVTEMLLDFDRMLKNILHFYRVLGETRVNEVQQIMHREESNLESVLGLFYQYASLCGGPEQGTIVVPSLRVRYEYAGFFLKTLGGRAYLYRRDSRTRILLTYYAVLTLHEANQEVLNEYGIDIVPYLEPLSQEIEARNDLTLKEMYLSTLDDLMITYAAARSRGGMEAGE